jgi:hypothetical protein
MTGKSELWSFGAMHRINRTEFSGGRTWAALAGWTELVWTIWQAGQGILQSDEAGALASQP